VGVGVGVNTVISKMHTYFPTGRSSLPHLTHTHIHTHTHKHTHTHAHTHTHTKQTHTHNTHTHTTHTHNTHPHALSHTYRAPLVQGWRKKPHPWKGGGMACGGRGERREGGG